MEDLARRCALPGCDVEIEDIPGRPARRYCTAAHRAAARQARRASIQPDQQVRLTETLPWLREPDPEPPRARSAVSTSPCTPAAPVPSRPAPAPGRRGGLAARLGERLPRRRGAIAVIGAAGILAGGYTVTSSQVVQPPGPTQSTPQGETSDGWAARAQVTLTSVDRQLDTIARTEAAWNAMPEHDGMGTPVPVADMLNRKALLQRRKAALQSQLDNYRALSRARADLELSEHNLDAVEQALKDSPPTGTISSPDEVTALAALQEQRDLRLRQRDAKKLELAGLEGNVEKAAHVPLPDDGQQTTLVSNEVMDVIHGDHRGRGPTVPTPGPQRPELLSVGREGQQGKERQATTTSAPPDPRGPRDETTVRPAGLPPQASGPGNADDRTSPSGEDHGGPVTTVAGKVGDTLGGAVDGFTGRKESGSEDGGSSDSGPGGGGLIGKVGDTLGGAVDGFTGRKERGSGDGGSKGGGSEDGGSKDGGSSGAGSEVSGSEDGGSKDGGSKDGGSDGGGLIGEVGGTLGGAVDVLTGRTTGGSQDSGSQDSGSQDSGSQDSGSQGGEVADGEAADGGTAPDGAAVGDASVRTAPPSAASASQQPSGRGRSDRVASQRKAVVPDADAVNSAVETAMTIVRSVPGGDVAAPAVKAAIRKAMAPSAEQPGSEKGAGPSHSRSAQDRSAQVRSAQDRSSRHGSSPKPSGRDAGGWKKHEADSSGSKHAGTGPTSTSDERSETGGDDSGDSTSRRQKSRDQDSRSQESGDEKSDSQSSDGQDPNRRTSHKKRDPAADSQSSTSWGTWPDSSSSPTSSASDGSGTSGSDSGDSDSSSSSSGDSSEGSDTSDSS